jgi:hypothetical protein
MWNYDQGAISQYACDSPDFRLEVPDAVDLHYVLCASD